MKTLAGIAPLNPFPAKVHDAFLVTNNLLLEKISCRLELLLFCQITVIKGLGLFSVSLSFVRID